MADERSNHQESEPQSSDSPLQRRAGYSGGSGVRPNGKRGGGLAADGAGATERDGLPEQDNSVEAEILDPRAAADDSQLVGYIRSAPLPDPEELRAYERVEPGLANRIVKMAESSVEALNAATKSNAAVNNALAESILEDGHSVRRGQWMFFTLAIAFLVTAIVLEFSGRALANNSPYDMAVKSLETTPRGGNRGYLV